MINREEMLELTRRMTASRTHLMRVAGAYMDEEGYVDGTFNTNFLNLKGPEKQHAIDIAKTIPFSETNTELKDYPAVPSSTFMRILASLRECGLKNDALLLTFYEALGEKLPQGRPYAIYIYQGIYDVTRKAGDKEVLEDSEEVYSYLIGAFCPLKAPYEADLPTMGFLWPAFTDRTTDMGTVNIYDADCRDAFKDVLLG